MKYKKILLINPCFNVEWKGVTPPSDKAIYPKHCTEKRYPMMYWT